MRKSGKIENREIAVGGVITRAKKETGEQCEMQFLRDGHDHSQIHRCKFLYLVDGFDRIHSK